MTMKLPLTALSLPAAALCAAVFLPASAVPASAAALSPAFSQMNGAVAVPSSPLVRIHSTMHANCANHYGSYHKHVIVRPRRCVEWAAEGSTEGPTRRICTRWIFLPTAPGAPPRYKIVRCTR